MKQSTMNLFLAPWEIEQNMDVFELYNCKDWGSFACTDKKNAKRFVRLPELYDSLDDAQRVLKEVLIEWSNGGDYDTYIAKKRKETGKAPPDYFVEWLELLKQVAEGNDNAR